MPSTQQNGQGIHDDENYDSGADENREDRREVVGKIVTARGFAGFRVIYKETGMKTLYVVALRRTFVFMGAAELLDIIAVPRDIPNLAPNREASYPG